MSRTPFNEKKRYQSSVFVGSKVHSEVSCCVAASMQRSDTELISIFSPNRTVWGKEEWQTETEHLISIAHQNELCFGQSVSAAPRLTGLVPFSPPLFGISIKIENAFGTSHSPDLIKTGLEVSAPLMNYASEGFFVGSSGVNGTLIKLGKK